MVERLQRHRAERADQHRHHLPGPGRGLDHGGDKLPHLPDARHPLLGLCRPSPSAPPAGCCSASSCTAPAGEKVNPLIGSAGVSAVPMAARVAHRRSAQRGQPAQLPAHARHGAQRGRRHRLGRRGRRAAGVVQVIVRPVRESRRGEEKNPPCDLHFSSPGDCASFWRPDPCASGVFAPGLKAGVVPIRFRAPPEGSAG